MEGGGDIDPTAGAAELSNLPNSNNNQNPNQNQGRFSQWNQNASWHEGAAPMLNMNNTKAQTAVAATNLGTAVGSTIATAADAPGVGAIIQGVGAVADLLEDAFIKPPPPPPPPPPPAAPLPVMSTAPLAGAVETNVAAGASNPMNTSF